MEPERDRTVCWEELASRTSSGLVVTLLWQRDHGNVHVRVVDARIDATFELTVAREKALEAFYHPYAYAATRS